MWLRRALALAVALAATLVSARARAWQEAHQVGDDVRMRLDENGSASIRHLVRWRVIRGPLKAIELGHVDSRVVLDPDVHILGEDGRESSGHLVRKDPGALRIVVDEPRLLMRGTFTFEFGWTIDTVSTQAIVQDGPNWRLDWHSLAASDGVDSARFELDVPAAPEPPRAVIPETGAVDDELAGTLRQEQGRDVLELIRPHVARGESFSWSVRIDARALPHVFHPGSRPAPAANPASAEPDRFREVKLAMVFGGLALIFGMLVASRAASFAEAAAAHGVRATGLVPTSTGPRSVLAGLSLAAGCALQVSGSTVAGGCLVAVGALAAVLRICRAGRDVRGPGRWLALRAEDAFATGAQARIFNGRNAALAAMSLALIALLGLGFRGSGSQRPLWIVVLDATVLVPVFVTGRVRHLPPSGTSRTGLWLGKVFGRIRAMPPIRVVPWARVGAGESAGDELRLLVLPRAAMPGVVGIELGLSWASTIGGWSAAPEILVRVLEASAAARWLSHTMAGFRAVPGRRTDERVLRLSPRVRSVAGTAALASELAELLTDRRAVDGKVWLELDRRSDSGREEGRGVGVLEPSAPAWNPRPCA